MECNRDEAMRAKELAEKKFLAKDIAGAKKFAAKAQNLYPDLEGISHTLATLNVYMYAENKINGEVDWYGILDVNPLADDETVRKQYRKLALMLHPDKNKSVGAEGAFKLISEAWSLLSDKAKRLTYDQKRKGKALQQKIPPPSGGSSAPPGSNGFFNFAKSTTSHTRPPKGNVNRVDASSAPASLHKQKPATVPPSSHKQKPATVPASSYKQNPTTFWTVCHRCKMQFEYLRMYLNRNLLCPNCEEPYFSFETPPPSMNGSKVSERNQSQQCPNSNHQRVSRNMSSSERNKSGNPYVGSGGFSSPDSSNDTKFQWGPFSKTTDDASAAQAASMVQQAYEKVKREREEAQAAAKREEALRRKNHTSKRRGSVSSHGHSSAVKRSRGTEDLRSSKNNMNQLGMRTGVDNTSSLSGLKQGNSEQGKLSGTSKPSGARDISKIEIQYLLMEKARMEIRKKLSEWSSDTVVESAVNGKENVHENAQEKEKEEDNAMVYGGRQDQSKTNEPVDARNGVPITKSIPSTSGGNLDKKLIKQMSIDVPDPDFHDFDRDRTERCFGENQVWAAYDDDDGMPRYYAMIHNVISVNPFKMRISWLNSKTNNELGPLNWIGSGFSKTCGDFRTGKHEINSSLNSFSHKIRWTKGTRGAVQIYPRKGDVWALYRNWSPEWDELTEDEVVHRYDMVEVLEDYDEELGVTVTPLVKVAGFKTVFHQHLDLRKVRRIGREEMFCFSHQIPSYLLTGQEAPNAPKGCWELDPAATPFELLEVIIDVNGGEIAEEDVKNDKENIGDTVGKTNNQESEENSSKVG